MKLTLNANTLFNTACIILAAALFAIGRVCEVVTWP